MSLNCGERGLGWGNQRDAVTVNYKCKHSDYFGTKFQILKSLPGASSRIKKVKIPCKRHVSLEKANLKYMTTRTSPSGHDGWVLGGTVMPLVLAGAPRVW